MTGLIWWAMISLVIVLAIFAGSVTRFSAGDAPPDHMFARVVVSDPTATSGKMLSLNLEELATFRRTYPGASLAPPPTSGSVVLDESGARHRNTLRVTYSATALPDGVTEMIVHVSRPFSEPPGGLYNLTWRYQVVGNHIEPKVLVDFDPFLSWVFAAFAGFVLSLVLGAISEHWLIKRPLARGEWFFAPSFNRDWLFTRVMPTPGLCRFTG